MAGRGDGLVSSVGYGISAQSVQRPAVLARKLRLAAASGCSHVTLECDPASAVLLARLVDASSELAAARRTIDPIHVANADRNARFERRSRVISQFYAIAFGLAAAHQVQLILSSMTGAL